MALKMSFFDQARAVQHDDAYWRLTYFSYSRERKNCELVFSAYSSQNAAIDGRDPITTKAFNLIGEEFNQVEVMLTTGFKGKVYELAKVKQEVVGKDPDGNDIFKAFFAEATDV
jgi:hypothetical protein